MVPRLLGEAFRSFGASLVVTRRARSFLPHEGIGPARRSGAGGRGGGLMIGWSDGTDVTGRSGEQRLEAGVS